MLPAAQENSDGVIAGASRALLLACVVAFRAAAQEAGDVRLETGYARVDQKGFRPADAALVAVFWRKPTDRFTLLTSGNLTYARDSLAAAQGVAAFVFPWASREHLRTDVGAAGATFSLHSAGRGGNGNGFLRQHYVADLWGAWGGTAFGLSSRSGNRSQSYAVDIGAWTRWRAIFASASLSRQNSDDFQLLYASGGLSTSGAPTYEFEDWQVVASARRGPHELTGSWTRRHSVAGTDFRAEAVAVAGTLQLSDRLAFLASAGRQLADPVRGLPQADIITASLRLSLGPKPLPVMERATIAEAFLQSEPGGGVELIVRVAAVDSIAVQVAGDFSEWKPVFLEREGDYWVARVALPPGKYHVGVRANLGPWRAPRNLARVRDDFGGESGLIVVP